MAGPPGMPDGVYDGRRGTEDTPPTAEIDVAGEKYRPDSETTLRREAWRGGLPRPGVPRARLQAPCMDQAPRTAVAPATVRVRPTTGKDPPPSSIRFIRIDFSVPLSFCAPGPAPGARSDLDGD